MKLINYKKIYTNNNYISQFNDYNYINQINLLQYQIILMIIILIKVLEVATLRLPNVHASSGVIGAEELVDNELGAGGSVNDGLDKQFKQGNCAQLMTNKQFPKAPLPLLILSMPPNKGI